MGLKSFFGQDPTSKWKRLGQDIRWVPYRQRDFFIDPSVKSQVALAVMDPPVLPGIHGPSLGSIRQAVYSYAWDYLHAGMQRNFFSGGIHHL